MKVKVICKTDTKDGPVYGCVFPHGTVYQNVVTIKANIKSTHYEYETEEGGIVYIEESTGILKTRKDNTKLDNLSSLKPCK